MNDPGFMAWGGLSEAGVGEEAGEITSHSLFISRSHSHVASDSAMRSEAAWG